MAIQNTAKNHIFGQVHATDPDNISWRKYLYELN